MNASEVPTATPASSAVWRDWHDTETSIQIGVSSCLLGDEVRFDGGHKRSRFITDVLGTWVQYVKVCPEVESGMSIPRPTVRLVDEGDGIRLMSPKTGEDFTDSMRSFAGPRAQDMLSLGLDGFILKKGSPSCGMERLPIYRAGQPYTRTGSGLFAEALMEQCPQLPVEEEGRLFDPPLRENFIERVFCRNRWRNLASGGLTRRRLIAFHTAHKLLLLAHNEAAYRRLGRLLGSAGTLPDSELFSAYEAGFQNCLRTRTTLKRHINVLQHALGHFKSLIGARERQEVIRTLDDFKAGLIPLIVPVTIFRHLIHTHQVTWLQEQLYFSPHPRELMLRNHV